jgi:dimethylargininase
MVTVAITRKPGRNFAQGITSSDLGPPDYSLMLEQHRAYVATLQKLGIEVIVLEALDDFPDAYFVEDTAIVTEETAIITRPGAASRRGEEDAILPVLRRFRNVERILPPATLEGGDVLRIENNFFVGISERTNQEGAEQLTRILGAQGKSCTAVPLLQGLHLKSSVNYVGKDTLLVTEDFATHPVFEGYQKFVLDRGEVYAANTLLVNDHLITPTGFPSTRKKLNTLGLPVIELEVSEARKMDGGLTCMSLRL